MPLGPEFYSIILSTEPWQAIENRSGRVVLAGKESGKSDILWRFVRNTDGSYVIYSALDGRCMTVANSEDKNGARIVMENYTGLDSQKWNITSSGNGYALSPKNSERMLDLAGANKNDGTLIQIYDSNGHWAQVWSLYNHKSIYLRAPELTVSRGTAETPTEFSWNHVNGETSHYIDIWKGGKNDGELVHQAGNINSVAYSVQLEPGYYEAEVTAQHYYEKHTSNLVSFTVIDRNAPVKSAFYNGHAYSLVNSSMIWDRSNNYCTNTGSYLASITFEEEQAVVNGLLSSAIDAQYWIGLSDAADAGSYEWVTDEPFGYKNWADGQPDNYGDKEHYVSLYRDGTWNDLPNEVNRIAGYIMETDMSDLQPVRTLTANGSTYMVYNQPVPWSAADAFARELGGHLVTITSGEENQVVSGLLDSAIESGDESSEIWYWTAGSDIGRQTFDYVWTNGEAFEYNNWMAEQPDNFIDIENYIALNHNGDWNDYALEGYLMSGNGFVVEMPADSEDDPETQIRIDGSAVISLKPGQSSPLRVTVSPAGTSVTWETDNSAVALVDGNGNVTAVSPGTATITAKADDKSVTFKVTVADSAALPQLNVSVISSGRVGGTPVSLLLTPAQGDLISVLAPYAAGSTSVSAQAAPGTYVLSLTKPGHTSYIDRSFTVGTDSLPSSIELCAGDINADNAINAKDQAAMTELFGRAATDESYTISADFNEDGYINAKDRADIIANFGQQSVIVD